MKTQVSLEQIIKTTRFLRYLKSQSQLPKKICFICFNENPLKRMKNAFYLILEALLFLKIFKVFVLVFWSYRT